MPNQHQTNSWSPELTQWRVSTRQHHETCKQSSDLKAKIQVVHMQKPWISTWCHRVLFISEVSIPRYPIFKALRMAALGRHSLCRCRHATGWKVKDFWYINMYHFCVWLAFHPLRLYLGSLNLLGSEAPSSSLSSLQAPVPCASQDDTGHFQRNLKHFTVSPTHWKQRASRILSNTYDLQFMEPWIQDDPL